MQYVIISGKQCFERIAMITRLFVRNFKRFDEAEIDLGNPIVLVGPNQSGKTSIMQALSLWNIGVRRWSEKRTGKGNPDRQSGVTISPRELTDIPHPSPASLWHNLRVRNSRRVEGKLRTDNTRIEITVDGVDKDKAWRCGLEFDYANEGSFYCRPLRLGQGNRSKRMPVPDEARATRVVFLPPLSGLIANEPRLDTGAINVRIGEGRTAEVLRNLCLRVLERDPKQWRSLAERIRDMFAIELQEPRYVGNRGEIVMGYREGGLSFDISSSGRGFQQILLILAVLDENPGSVIMLDEPNAHQDMLLRRQVYRLITETAWKNGSQIIASSHSELLLNEAVGKDTVISLVGKPHRIHPASENSAQGGKGFHEIGSDQFYQAEQTGWGLYLEKPSDLAILQGFARRLGKADATSALERPFVFYFGHRLPAAKRHFHALKDRIPDFKGLALTGNYGASEIQMQGKSRSPSLANLEQKAWKRRDILNYLCSKATLEAYARHGGNPGATDFSEEEKERSKKRVSAMRESISEVFEAFALLGKESPWNDNINIKGNTNLVKISVGEDFLSPLFSLYFEKLGLPNLMKDKGFHELVDSVPREDIDPEVADALDAIVAVAESVAPGKEGQYQNEPDIETLTP